MRQRSRFVRLVLPFAAAASLVMVGGPAQAATVSVNVIDFAFQPASAKANQGDTVNWTFDGVDTVNHTATDSTGMGLFDSGSMAPGTSFSFQFVAAGSYSYKCTIHPTLMKGTVKVPVKGSPGSGTVTTTFTITWASVNAAAGYVYDVQISRPGGGGFVDWLTGQALGRAKFTPDGGTGTYQFKARLRNTGNGKASGYSAAKKITVS